MNIRMFSPVYIRSIAAAAMMLLAIILLTIWWVDHRRGAAFEPANFHPCENGDCSEMDQSLLSEFRNTSTADFEPWAPIDFCQISINVLSKTRQDNTLRLIPSQLERDGIITVSTNGDVVTVSPGVSIEGVLSPFHQWLPGAKKASCHQSAYGPALPLVLFFLLYLAVRFYTKRS